MQFCFPAPLDSTVKEYNDTWFIIHTNNRIQVFKGQKDTFLQAPETNKGNYTTAGGCQQVGYFYYFLDKLTKRQTEIQLEINVMEYIFLSLVNK